MKQYTILKGFHYANFLFGRLGGWHYNKKHIFITFMLNRNCWWYPPRNDDDYDWNKIYGLSFGIFGVHKNSVRIAWKPDFANENKFIICGYTYDNNTGIHTADIIGTINANIPYSATIFIENDKYKICVNGITIEMDNIGKDRKLQKELYPYFGGNNKSPQEMDLYINFMAYK